MVTANSDLQLSLDVIGVFVFALSGAVVAVRARLDVVGVLMLSWISGLGGGILRDLVLGATPPVGISDWRLLAAALSAGLVIFLAYEPARVVKTKRPGLRIDLVSRGVRVLDAAGLSVFAVSGTLKAFTYGTTWQAAIIVGGVTAVGGGLIRDVLVNQVPEILHRRELYITPALIGAALVVLAHEVGQLNAVTTWASVGVAFAIRLLTIWRGWQAPSPLMARGSAR